jgi:hypothetical protein
LSPLEFLMTDKAPIRRALKHFIAKARLGSFAFRYRIEALQRMQYAYILYQAASLAAKLGQRRISAIEFGVAGGRGLLCMERYAEQIERLFPVEFEIYGFDTGGGLPAPKDYRDLPYKWQQGFFAMDQEKLTSKLTRSKLILGDVAQTWATFVDTHSPAPIAAVAHDLDFYSSTADGLKLFGIDDAHLSPRIFCYFDDTLGTELELYSDFTGERLAIHEFNAANDRRKIAIPYYLRAQEGLGSWRHQIWVCHLFDHPRYNEFVAEQDQQLPLAV